MDFGGDEHEGCGWVIYVRGYMSDASKVLGCVSIGAGSDICIDALSVFANSNDD